MKHIPYFMLHKSDVNNLINRCRSFQLSSNISTVWSILTSGLSGPNACPVESGSSKYKVIKSGLDESLIESHSTTLSTLSRNGTDSLYLKKCVGFLPKTKNFNANCMLYLLIVSLYSLKSLSVLCCQNHSFTNVFSYLEYHPNLSKSMRQISFHLNLQCAKTKFIKLRCKML